MKLNKFLAIPFFISIHLIAMDGEHPSSLQSYDGHRKQQADQTAQESRPTKEAIAQTIMQANILPNVLAPLIAAYAENPHKKYMFIQNSMTISFLEYDYDLGENGASFLGQYTAKYPELSKGLTAYSLMIQVCFSDKQSCFDISDLRRHYMKRADCDCLSEPESDNYPSYLPANSLKHLKEDDSYCVTLHGEPYEFVCSQLGHIFAFEDERPCPFEERFSIETKGKLESAKKQIDED